MILEILSYITSPAPKWAKKLGYLTESIGIEARYERCKDAWASHLENSKQAIRDAAKTCTLKRTALIVGSGPGYDLPLEELANDFNTIILLDAVHPKYMKSRVKKLHKEIGHEKVILFSGDITELCDRLIQDPNQIPVVGLPSLYHGFPDIDLVVSLNIASQLSISPTTWLQSHGVDNDEAITKFGHDMVAAHLQWMLKFEKAIKLLICDRQWVTKEILQGRVLERIDPLDGVKMPRPDKLWNWQICPVEEMPKADRNANLSRENVVGAHIL
ncbi:hypothetical protein [Curvivirga aplysinae]|uniref:hypothetical protein n=1 Tax=Curvivirga aplysinae TaxID=2529852 RepID=UPI0012BD5159|nr:hypothetical protein [Curvivirga aplysinae]MTI11297.1 hypothetical protein [Curvivirga aplysinae]